MARHGGRDNKLHGRTYSYSGAYGPSGDSFASNNYSSYGGSQVMLSFYQPLAFNFFSLFTFISTSQGLKETLLLVV